MFENQHFSTEPQHPVCADRPRCTVCPCPRWNIHYICCYCLCFTGSIWPRVYASPGERRACAPLQTPWACGHVTQEAQYWQCRSGQDSTEAQLGQARPNPRLAGSPLGLLWNATSLSFRLTGVIQFQAASKYKISLRTRGLLSPAHFPLMSSPSHKRIHGVIQWICISGFGDRRLLTLFIYSICLLYLYILYGFFFFQWLFETCSKML